MTRAQRRVLDAIEAFIAEHRHSPTLREIASAVGLRSAATVSAHVRNLELDGFLRPRGGRRRAVDLMRPFAPEPRIFLEPRLGLMEIVWRAEPTR